MNRLKPGIKFARCFSSAGHIARVKLLGEQSVDGTIDVFWLKQLNRVNRPSALNLIELLVPSNSLGYSGAVDSTRSVSVSTKLRTVDMATGWKRMHPDMVVLVRLGDFYETWGIDAVMLVQYAGLNPMGDSCRAGFPKGNIQQTLNSLTEAGLSVAVYEEANVAGSRSTKIRKERFLSQIVSPGRPLYLHETSLREGELPYLASKPFVAIKCSAKIGCSLAFLHVDSGEIRVTENVAEEALGSFVDSVGGVADPIYVCADHSVYLIGGQKKFPPSLSFEAFLTAATTDLSSRLAIDSSQFRRIARPCVSTGLQPLHANAADFLGILSNSSPSLVDALVQTSSPFHVRQFFRTWLLCPPNDPLVIEAMRSFLTALGATNGAVPAPLVIPVDKLVRLITSGNGNVNFFTDLFHACDTFLASPALVLSPEVWTIVNHLSGVVGVDEKISKKILKISKLVKTHIKTTNIPQNNEKVFSELGRLIRSSECVLAGILGNFSNLDLARENLILAVSRSLVSPEKSLKFDALSGVLYVKEIDVAIIKSAAKKKPVPHDTRKRFSTDLILAAEIEYKSAVEAAKTEAKKILLNLSAQLAKDIQALVSVSHWSVLISSTLAHASHASRIGWTNNLEEKKNGLFSVQNFAPFWLSQGSVNSMTLFPGRPGVLTAPNESGKSTLLRSVGAVVWLTSCGLFAPGSGTPIARLLVVSPTGDRPVEGMSAFAAEAEAMAAALKQVESPCLLLVDEFGRGTSSRDATALSEAVLNYLANRPNANVLWATHLHELFRTLVRVDWLQMDAQFKLQNGQCVDSRGIATARDRGIFEEICRMAEKLVNTNIVEDRDSEIAKCLDKGLEKRLDKENTELVERANDRLGLRLDDSNIVAKLDELVGGQLPPPRVTHVVYVLRFGEKYYIGETQNYAQRLRAHTRKFKGAPDQAWFEAQPNRGAARVAETNLIQKCMHLGLPLLSTFDGNHLVSKSCS